MEIITFYGAKLNGREASIFMEFMAGKNEQLIGNSVHELFFGRAYSVLVLILH